MTHTYNVSGMTCSGCQVKVQAALEKVKGVKTVSINPSRTEATITMDNHVPITQLIAALAPYPKYSITEKEDRHAIHTAIDEEKQNWLQQYKPILLVFAFILGITILAEANTQNFDAMRWMRHFMAGFFLVFSFFKLLNLQGFAESYYSYDIIARKWTGWGYVYAFIELALGIAFLVNFNPLLVNGITFALMSVSIIGVVQSVFNKRKIRCACLGAVFNLPMSTITIIEVALMIAMSLYFLISFL